MGDHTKKGSNKRKVPREPVRPRWTPKPEQILILETIFNSGMVNPPKEETANIRRLLEKFGTVGDANVFYWFQNRRSRSRRRQRQMQQAHDQHAGDNTWSGGSPIVTEEGFDGRPSSTSSFVSTTTTTTASTVTVGMASSSFDSSDFGRGIDWEDLFSISRQMGFSEIHKFPALSSSSASNLHGQIPGLITIFINGIPAEVPSGPFDMRAIFGRDLVLVHSSGEVILVNEYGVLFRGLHAGEGYFLIRSPT